MCRLMTMVLFLTLCGLTAGCGVNAKKRSEAEVHFILGVSYLREQNPTLALKEFLIAEKLDPEKADIQAGLGQAYQLKKAFGEAEIHYLRALELNSDSPEFHNNLGALYLDMRRWDEAIRHFRLASSNLLFTSPEVALAGMASAYYQKGAFAEAAVANREALRHNPQYYRAHFQLGEAYFALEKNDLAVAEFLQAINLVPTAAAAHYKLGLAYMKAGETRKAAASFREAIRLAPDSEEARLAGDYLKLLR